MLIGHLNNTQDTYTDELNIEAERRLSELPTVIPICERTQSDPSACCDAPLMLYVSGGGKKHKKPYCACHKCDKEFLIDYKTGKLIYETI